MQVWNIVFSEKLYQQAKDYFLTLGRSDFLQKSALSLCGRYCISQKMAEFGFLDFIPEDGIYTCEPYTYAISHSHNQLFFAVDEQNITVDVEKIIERDEALLYNLPLLNTAFSLWENFYFQWCAKECLVKYLNLRSTQMAQMQVKEIGVLNKSQLEPVELEFGFVWYLLLEYDAKEYLVRLVEKGEYLFALLR